jgi:outer membrane receptor for ferrienterochelin and colicins
VNIGESAGRALDFLKEVSYSSENISRVLSQGLTLDIKTRISNVIKLSLGYQYLEVKDKDILDKLEGEGVYAQDPETLSSYRVDKKDYGGLLYRSKHTANFKFLATNFYKEFSGNFRVLYKGKSGFRDTNNNNILDVDNEYTDAYYLVNTSVSKSLFKNKLKLQVGIDNLLDFTYATPEYTISSLPGRTYFTTINYKF